VDDDGIAIDRYITTGWQKLSGEDSYLFGVIVEMRKSSKARIKVSVARNFNPTFEREQIFSLRAINPDPAIDRVECNLRFPSPLYGSWFNIKIRLYQDNNSSTTELFKVGFITRPLHKYPVTQQQMPYVHEDRGS
jgi:hypothetical protein